MPEITKRGETHAKLCLHCEMTWSIPRLWYGTAYAPAVARSAGRIMFMALIPGMVVCLSKFVF